MYRKFGKNLRMGPTIEDIFVERLEMMKYTFKPEWNVWQS